MDFTDALRSTLRHRVPQYRNGFEPLLPGFVFCNYNDLEDFEKSIDDQTVAILVESIQGEGGLTAATDEFLLGLESLCNQYNLLLIDEVQAGIARMETLGSKIRAKPHAVALAKVGWWISDRSNLRWSKHADLFTPQVTNPYGGYTRIPPRTRYLKSLKRRPPRTG